jgi:prevent-host-death family protein
MAMVTVSSEEVRDGLGELINRVAYGGERVMVTRRGKKIVGIISAEEMELLEAVLDSIEDEIDIPLVKERLAEIEKGECVSLEQLKSELGL